MHLKKNHLKSVAGVQHSLCVDDECDCTDEAWLEFQTVQVPETATHFADTKPMLVTIANKSLFLRMQRLESDRMLMR
jgi:hypothetical protein